ncbi:MAG: precorrin-8X methylmutase [Pseudomonadota bacterium]
MGALFDNYLIVDWSAANAPKTGKDSIWIALSDGADLQWIKNSPTRNEAMELIARVCRETLNNGKRVFAGFDFAFGYPVGSALKLTGDAGWKAVWSMLERRIVDCDDNRNNSYELAAVMNRTAFSDLPEGPFWGHPHQHTGRYPGLQPTKPTSFPTREFRHAERAAKGAKSVWQLAYNGTVGRQAMMGMAHLERLRAEFDGAAGVWPFQTCFTEDLSKPICIAEIYPSLFPVTEQPGEVRDAAQVRTLATQFAELDAADLLRPLLSRPADMGDEEADAVLTEEGWIVGAGHRRLQPSSSEDTFDYQRDPAEIYTQSFATIENEVNLSAYSPPMARVVTRLVHACGMTDIVDDLAFSDGAAEDGLVALQSNCNIYCDVEMVKAGIITSALPADCSLVCTLNDPRAAELGKRTLTTRSAAAVELWDDLDGAICVIGNAPTALFRLLERIDEGAGVPALIVGIPVGFVGAVESKQALAENPRGSRYFTVHGRRGGSAMASSVVNALSGQLR